MSLSKNSQEQVYLEFNNYFKNRIVTRWKEGYHDLEIKFKNLIKNKDIILKPRFIRDPLWGEIRLSPICSFFLDTFFMQRLRGITHMGFVNMVFPASNHRRFDHSLGTLAVISYILDERFLKRRQSNYNSRIQNTYSSWLTSYKSYFNLLTNKISSFKTYNQELLSKIIEYISPLQSICHNNLNKKIRDFLSEFKEFYRIQKGVSDWENFVEKEKIVDILSQIFNDFSKKNLEPISSEFMDIKNPGKNLENFRNKICEELKLAMLLHDIGHFPYSHVFENYLKRNKDKIKNYRNIDFLKGSPHEIRTRDLILGVDPVINSLINPDKPEIIYESIKEISNFLPKEQGFGINSLDPFSIAVSISGKSEFPLSKLINGPLDSDKMDYLARDQYFAISPTIFKIFDRIFRNMQIDVKTNELVFNYKILNTILKVIVTRQFAFNDIIFHPTNLCAQALLISLLNLILRQYDEKYNIEILKRLELTNERELYNSLEILNTINYTKKIDNKKKEYQEIAEKLLYNIQYRNLYKSVYEIPMDKLIENKKSKEFKKYIDDFKKDDITSFFLPSLHLEEVFANLNLNIPDEFSLDSSDFLASLKESKSGLLIFHNCQKVKKISSYLEKLYFKMDDQNIKNLKSLLGESLQKYYNVNDWSSITSLLNDENDILKILSIFIDKFRLDLFRFFDIVNERLYFYVDPKILKEAREFFDEIEDNKYKWEILLYILGNSLE